MNIEQHSNLVFMCHHDSNESLKAEEQERDEDAHSTSQEPSKNLDIENTPVQSDQQNEQPSTVKSHIDHFGRFLSDFSATVDKFDSYSPRI